jgi:hypothetical protein
MVVHDKAENPDGWYIVRLETFVDRAAEIMPAIEE